MQRSLKELEHYVVCATDGEVGRVVDFLLDDEHWTVRYLVVHTGGFFSGRKILISPIAFRELDASARELHVALTREMLKASPDINADQPVSRQHERAYNRYYGYPYYWNSMGPWGMGLYPALLSGAGGTDAPVEPANEHTGDAHLRSASELRRYHVQGTDDAIGHVADFIADDATWGVQYLVVDTSNWWFGRKVLIAPQWAHRVSWPEGNVYIAMTRTAIQQSPEWDGSAALTSEYEQRLRDYFRLPLSPTVTGPSAGAASTLRADASRTEAPRANDGGHAHTPPDASARG